MLRALGTLDGTLTLLTPSFDLADERDRRVITGLANQFLLALLGMASGIVAALMFVAPGGPKIAQSVSLYQLIGYNMLIVSGVLVLRVLFTIFKTR